MSRFPFFAVVVSLAAPLASLPAQAQTCSVMVTYSRSYNHPQNIGYEVVNAGRAMQQAGLYIPGAKLVDLSVVMRSTGGPAIAAWRYLEPTPQGSLSGPAITLSSYSDEHQISDGNWDYMNLQVPRRSSRSEGTLDPQYLVVNATGSGRVSKVRLTVEMPRGRSCSGGRNDRFGGDDDGYGDDESDDRDDGDSYDDEGDSYEDGL